MPPRTALALWLALGCSGPNPAFFPEIALDAGVDARPSADRLAPPDQTKPDQATAPADGASADQAPTDTAAPPEPPPDATSPDGATQDALPPGATATLRAVSVGSGGTTTVYGGTGGSGYTDDCGTEGQVVIGYAGYKWTFANSTNEYVIAMQAVCGRLEIPPGSTAVRVASMRTLALRGDERETSWQALCPADQVIVGYAALIDDGEQTENLQFHCAHLSVIASPPGSVVPGPVTTLPWVGRMASARLITTSCPAGQVGRGHVVRVGSWIDAFHMTCGPLSADP